MLTRYALIGAGHRAQMYLDAIAGPHADVAELVALLDVNPTRRAFHRDRVPAFADVVLAGPEQLEEVIEQQRVDRVIVTSVDRFHAEHVVRALDAGADVIVEKPLTIDAPSACAIQEAIDRTGRSVVVTFNYRYSPRNTALKQVIASGEIGEVPSVSFEWVLDTQHGADYFRRWHRDKTSSGGLFVHKAAHHFDLVNWWIDDVPARVYARGGLRFYGADAASRRGQAALPERGTHDGAHDPFELDLRSDQRLEALYLDAEQHDGYLRDRSVFDPGITTEDTLTAIVDYAGGPVLTYALTAHGPWEGYRVAVNGTKGRAELEVVERAEVIARGEEDADSPAHLDPSAIAVTSADAGARERGERLVVQKHFAPAREVEIPEGVGGHGGGDALLLRDVFVGPAEDALGRPSDHRDGLRAIAVGICGNESLATALPVDVAEHLGLDLRRDGTPAGAGAGAAPNGTMAGAAAPAASGADGAPAGAVAGAAAPVSSGAEETAGAGR